MVSRQKGGGSFAAAIQAGERLARRVVGAQPIMVRNDNLVERPWGGSRLQHYKQLSLADGKEKRFGEAFEISACPSDKESRANPSIVRFGDGSEMDLPSLLRFVGDEILGPRFYSKHDAQLPILPKTLDIGRLLSVQLHPPGNPELYIIVDADPGATVRLGLREQVDRNAVRRIVTEGRELQSRLSTYFANDICLQEIDKLVSATFVAQGDDVDVSSEQWRDCFDGGVKLSEVKMIVEQLKRCYWAVLDMLHEIPVCAGQILWNRTPDARFLAADIHALGNPYGKEILMLEVRRPTTTLRLWDHVRFPMRPVRIEDALQCTALQVSNASDYFISKCSANLRTQNTHRIVECDAFIVDMFCPAKGRDVAQERSMQPRTLHCTSGEIEIFGDSGESLGRLRAGQSVLIPVSMEAFRLTTTSTNANLVQVTIPDTAERV